MPKHLFIRLVMLAILLPLISSAEHGGGHGGGQHGGGQNGFDGGMAMGGGGGGGGGGGSSYQKNEDVNKTGETLTSFKASMGEALKAHQAGVEKGTQAVFQAVEKASKIPEAGEEAIKKLSEAAKYPDSKGVSKTGADGYIEELKKNSETQIATMQTATKGFGEKPAPVEKPAAVSRAENLAKTPVASSGRGLGTTPLGPLRKPASRSHGETYNSPLAE